FENELQKLQELENKMKGGFKKKYPYAFNVLHSSNPNVVSEFPRIGNKVKAVIDYIAKIKRIEVLSDLTGVKGIKSKTIENIIRLLPKFENELQKLQELENKMKGGFKKKYPYAFNVLHSSNPNVVSEFPRIGNKVKAVIDYIAKIKRIEVLSDLTGVKGIKSKTIENIIRLLPKFENELKQKRVRNRQRARQIS
ncbi:240_t:CDS:1, partial [Ambispora leptoticha]